MPSSRYTLLRPVKTTPRTLLHPLPGAPDPYRLVEGADGTTARLLTEELRSRAEALVGKVSHGRSARALLYTTLYYLNCLNYSSPSELLEVQ